MPNAEVSNSRGSSAPCFSGSGWLHGASACATKHLRHSRMTSSGREINVRVPDESRGTKRNFKEYQDKAGNASKMELDQPNHPSPFMPMFQTFRAELDEHHDRRERIIKVSRDITALSKKQ